MAWKQTNVCKLAKYKFNICLKLAIKRSIILDGNILKIHLFSLKFKTTHKCFESSHTEVIHEYVYSVTEFQFSVTMFLTIFRSQVSVNISRTEQQENRPPMISGVGL